MKFGTMLKKGVIILSAVLLAACAKHNHGGAEGDGLSANGLGNPFGGFGGQNAGEKYSTKAPSDQMYHFEYDDSSLNPKYLPSLNAQADYLKDHPNARVLIAGHTDERGSREYNIGLGERRANAVRQLMALKGVADDRVAAVSFGKEKPVALGHAEESWARNRRAELVYEGN